MSTHFSGEPPTLSFTDASALLFEGSLVGSFQDCSPEVMEDRTSSSGDEALLCQALAVPGPAGRLAEPGPAADLLCHGDPDAIRSDDGVQFFDPVSPDPCALSSFFDTMEGATFTAESLGDNFRSLTEGLFAADYFPHHFNGRDVMGCLDGADGWAVVRDRVMQMIQDKGIVGGNEPGRGSTEPAPGPTGTAP